MPKNTLMQLRKRRIEISRLSHPSFKLPQKFSIAEDKQIRKTLVKRMGTRARVLEIGGGTGISVNDILSQTRVKPSNFLMLDKQYGSTLRTREHFESGLRSGPKIGGDLFRAPFQNEPIFDVVLVRHVVATSSGLAGSKAGKASFRRREKQIEQRLRELGISASNYAPIVVRKLAAMKAIRSILEQYAPRLREKGCIFINAIPFNQSDLSALRSARFNEAIEVSRVLHRLSDSHTIYFSGMELLIARKK